MGETVPKVVIVTQPPPACNALCSALHAMHVVPLNMPAYHIVTQIPDETAMWQQRFCAAEHVVVTSQHCVAGLRPFLAEQRSVWAIGPSTQKALQAQGWQDVRIPPVSESAALLALPEFQQIDGCHILIVCGENPRPILHDTLQARGAVCSQYMVYRRQKALYTADTLKQLAAEQPALMTIHSGDGLRFLAESLSQDKQSPLWGCPLLHVHQRYVEMAKALGFTGEQNYAEQPTARAMAAVCQRILATE